MTPEEILIQNFKCESKSDCRVYKALLNTCLVLRSKQQALAVLTSIHKEDESDRDRLLRELGRYQGYIEAVSYLFEVIDKDAAI